MLHQDQFICRAGAPFRPTVSLLRLSMADGDAPGNPSGAVGGVRFSRNARRRSEAKRISDRITSRSTIRLGWPLGNTPTLNLYSRIRMRPSIPCAGHPLCAQELKRFDMDTQPLSNPAAIRASCWWAPTASITSCEACCVQRTAAPVARRPDLACCGGLAGLRGWRCHAHRCQPRSQADRLPDRRRQDSRHPTD